MTFYVHVALVCALFVAVSARSDVIQVSDVVVLDEKFVLPNDSAPAYDTLPLVSVHRRKRWVGAAAGLATRVAAVVKGAMAAKKVLKGTKPGKNKPSKTTNEHISVDEKPMDKANERFDSVKPNNVKEIKSDKVNGRTGQVGDRTITVRDKSSKRGEDDKTKLVDRPTVEVFKTGTPKKNRITIKVRHDKPVKSAEPKKSSGGWGWGGGSKTKSTSSSSSTNNSGSSSTKSGSSSSSSSGSKSSGGGSWWRRKRRAAVLVAARA